MSMIFNLSVQSTYPGIDIISFSTVDFMLKLSGKFTIIILSIISIILICYQGHKKAGCRIGLHFLDNS